MSKYIQWGCLGLDEAVALGCVTSKPARTERGRANGLGPDVVFRKIPVGCGGERRGPEPGDHSASKLLFALLRGPHRPEVYECLAEATDGTSPTVYRYRSSTRVRFGLTTQERTTDRESHQLGLIKSSRLCEHIVEKESRQEAAEFCRAS